MSDVDQNHRASWRAVPAALVVGLVLSAAVELSRIVIRMFADEFTPAVGVAGIANDFALAPLLAIGAFRLARGLHTSSAAGARVFGAACFGMLGLNVFYLGAMVVSVGPGPFPELLWKLSEWAMPAVGITMAIGIAMLASTRVHVLLIVGAIALVLIGFPIPLIAKPVFEAFGVEKVMLIEAVARAGFFIVALVIAIASRPIAHSGRAVVSSHGLRYISRALWMRIITAASLTGLTMLFVFSGAHIVGVFKLVIAVAAVVSLMAQVWFAVGALQATHADVPQYATSVAAACALWTAGVGLTQLMFMMQGFRWGDYSERGNEYAEVLPRLMPIIAALGVIAIIAAITGLARRRGAEALRQAASVRGIAFVAITLGILAIQFVGYGEIRSQGGQLLLSLGRAVGGLVSIALVAGLCGMAADELERGRQLPTARLRES